MINKKTLCWAIFLFGILVFCSSISAYTESYYGSQYNNAMGILSFSGGQSLKVDESMCQQGTDFIVQINGCEPAPVTSDLLEEENVNVFCKLSAIKINPLVDIKAIDQISFDKQVPKEVMAIGYQPAQSALGYTENTLEGSLILQNLGYVVITLKRQPNESALTNCEKRSLGGDICWVEGNLTAKLRYDVENVFGVGNAIFYLPVIEDKDWQNDFVQYSFWGGRGYLRAESVGEDSASISIYSDNSVASGLSRTGREYTLAKYNTRNLQVGKTSEKIFLPGISPCLASLQLTLQGVEYPDTRAVLKVNDDTFELAEDEYFLDNKCRVISMDGNDINSQVKIRCAGADESSERKALDLKIFPQVQLNIGGTVGEYAVGDWLYRTEDGQGKKSVYLGYIGTIGTKAEKDLYVYLVAIPDHNARLTEAQISQVQAYAETVRSSTDHQGKAVDEIITVSGAVAATIGRFVKSTVSGWDFYAIPYTNPTQQVSSVKVWEKEVSFEGYANEITDGFFSLSNNNYTNAMSDFETVVNSYPSEVEKVNSVETFGEKAMYEEILLANKLGKKKTLIELCNKFQEDYPNAYRYVDICENDLMLSNSETNTMEVTINGFVKEISLQEIREPSKEQYSATMSVQGPTGVTKTYVLSKNKPIYLEGTGLRDKTDEENLKTTEYIMLEELEDGSAKILINVQEKKLANGIFDYLFLSDSQYFKEDKLYHKFGDYKFSLTDITLEKIAKVSVTANTDLARSNSSFMFKIGVEKRWIILTPDQTKKKIESMNKTLEDWKRISDTFDGIVTAWKTTCAVTGGWLTVKNAYLNRGGKATAREEVMTGTGGWNERCAKMVPEEFRSIDECFSKNAEDIETEVNDLYDIMGEQNSQIAELKESTTDEQFSNQYSDQVSSRLKSLSGQTELKNVKNVTETLDSDGWKDGKYTTDQLKEIELYSAYLQEHSNDPVATQRLNSVLKDIAVNSREFLEEKTFEETVGMPVIIGEYGKSAKSEEIIIGADERVQFKDSPYTKMDIEGNIPSTSYVSPYKSFYLVSPETHTTREFFVVYDSVGAVTHTYEVFRTGTQTPVAKLYIDTTADSTKVAINPFDLHFKTYDKTSYQNEYEASYGGSEPLIRYFETGTYKGKPAIVPFDKSNGWYAGIQNPAVSYDSSARLTSLYVCNVGQNNIEEFQLDNFGDDTCELYSLNTEQKYTTFPGLDKSGTLNLVTRAQRAVQAAQTARARKEGISSLKIDGSGFSKAIKIGEPALESLTAQCTDFMSVKDCSLLFNVCDPVICPSSRCDYGGKYPVQNVIQSGIVGGFVLCYPNAKWKGGDVYVPFCLSAINAGAKGWISILEDYRDCLQTSLDTGETVGICDETRSIYTCQFFWKQGFPIIKLVGQGLINKISGNSAKGGGEYQGLTSALKNAQESLDYFKQYYAANSYNAFKLRSTEQFGTDVCGTFVSAVVPGGDFSEFLTNLFDPDVPFQFTGKFSETQLTTVTNPPTSQYKVWFNIYAGEDSGAYYTVYLRGSGSSYYQDTIQNRLVKSGYIPRGDSVDETIDFTSPSGYTQLCIVVNGQEECNFKEVSSSFAVNYLSDLYLAEQAKKTDIKTTDECTSGTLSLYSLLDLNPQSAANNLLNPELYNQGITRVCSTDNPGSGTDINEDNEKSQWTQVGYCDNTRVGCWMNTQNVKDAIKALNLEEEVLDKTSEDTLEYLSGNYLDDATFSSKMEEIKTTTDDTKRISLINTILNSVRFNRQKAGLYFWRGKSYSNLAIKDYEKIVAERITAGTSCTNGVTRACTIGNCAGTQICVNEQWGACTKTDSNCDSGIPGGNNPLSSFNAKYISPTIMFNDGNIFTLNDFCYRYYNSKWQWTDACGSSSSSSTSFSWHDASDFEEDIDKGLISREKDEIIIKGLSTQDGNYIGGLGWLVYKVLANTKGSISDKSFGTTTMTTMDDEGIFSIKFSDVTYEPMKIVYYKYENEKWFWQLDDKFEGGGIWQSTSNIAPGFNSEQKAIVSALNNKDLNNGAVILFDYSSEDIQELFGLEESTPTTTSLEDSLQKRDLTKLTTLMTSLSSSVFASSFKCYCGSDCDDYAEWIVESSSSSNIPDELLLLAIMIQESSCKSVESSGGDLGLMQINPKVHCGNYGLPLMDTNACKDILLNDNEKNINVGAQVLKAAYRTSAKTFNCGAVIISYTGWEAALRGYNGWGCTGDNNYVENVKSKYFELVNLYNNLPSSTPTCTDTCASKGYQCGTQTVCSKSINCGACTVVGQTCTNGKCVTSGGTGLTQLRSNILSSAEKLEGAIVPQAYNSDCSTAVSYIYKDASCGLSNCIYSAKSGKEYKILLSNGTIVPVFMGTQTKIVNGKSAVIFQTATNCKYLSDTLVYADVLKSILPGDRIDMVYDGNDGHGAIFINWVEDKENTARVFDWNGVTIYEGTKDSLGNTCTAKDFFSTTYKDCKSYQYKEYDLSMDKHPVYRIWNPVSV